MSALCYLFSRIVQPGASPQASCLPAVPSPRPSSICPLHSPKLALPPLPLPTGAWLGGSQGTLGKMTLTCKKEKEVPGPVRAEPRPPV